MTFEEFWDKWKPYDRSSTEMKMDFMQDLRVTSMCELLPLLEQHERYLIDGSRGIGIMLLNINPDEWFVTISNYEKATTKSNGKSYSCFVDAYVAAKELING